MRQTTTMSWLNAAQDMWSLGAEASLVVGMRLMRMSAGGAQAGAEARLMVQEKITAAAELQMKLVAAGSTMSPPAMTTQTIAHYRRAVAANSRRLRR